MTTGRINQVTIFYRRGGLHPVAAGEPPRFKGAARVVKWMGSPTDRSDRLNPGPSAAKGRPLSVPAAAGDPIHFPHLNSPRYGPP